MAIYRPTTSTLVSGALWTNTAGVWDANESTLCTKIAGKTTTTHATSWQGFSSLTGLSSMTVDIHWTGSVASGYNELAGEFLPYGRIVITYSWDGTTWTELDELNSNLDEFGGTVSGGGTSYSISDYAGKDLTNFRVKVTIYAGGSLLTGGDYRASGEISIAEIFVTAATGPIYTVNAITGSTSILPNAATQYSTTVTNDSADNSCSWTIVSGGGSLGAVTNDATSSRVVFTPPWTANTTVLRATCTHDASKYAEITVSNAGLTVAAITGATSVNAGQASTFSTTVTNDSADNSCSWTIVSGGGSLGAVTNDGTSSRVTWTAPTSSGGSAVLKATSTHNATKYAQKTVSVPAITITASGATTCIKSGQITFSATTTNQTPANTANWSCSGGSFAGNVWTAPATGGIYTVTATSPVDSSKTSTLTIYVDFYRPSTWTTVPDPDIAFDVTSEDLGCDAAGASTYGTASASYSGANYGAGASSLVYSGFPSVPGLSRINLTGNFTLSNNLSACEAEWSLNGVDWNTIDKSWQGYSDRHTTPLVLTIAPGYSFNLNQLKIRFVLGASWSYEWDDNFPPQQVSIYGDSFAQIWDLYVTVNTRGYVPITSLTPPTTTPKPIFSTYLFSATTGLMTAVTTDPKSYDGPDGMGRYTYFEGASGP